MANGSQTEQCRYRRDPSFQKVLLGSSNLNSILKSRDIILPKGPISQSYGFSCRHVQMWELDHKEGWALKNWCFLIVVVVRSLGREDPLQKKMVTHSSILAREIHGQRGLASHSPHGRKESDTTQQQSNNCGAGEDPWAPWTARSNQPILKEINPEYSLEALMLKLQYSGHLKWRANSLEKILRLERLKATGEGGDRGWDG